MNRRVARALVGLLLVAGSVAGNASPVAAAGTWMAPVRDRYEVGDIVTLVGYTGPTAAQGWIDDGPFYGYLHESGKAPGVPSERGEPLGPITIEPTGTTGWTALRVSIEVSLAGLAPGRYEVGYCNDPCSNGLGELIGSRTINVGVDPTAPVVREWPLDEPLIQILRPDAMVSGPGYLVPAREIWAGRVVPAQSPPPPSVPAPVTTVASSPPSGIAPAAPTPVVLPQRALDQPVVTVPGTAPPRSEAGDDGSPLFVVLGAVLATLCTASVLRAMRQDGTVPARAPATPVTRPAGSAS